jgi:hypothetical protein
MSLLPAKPGDPRGDYRTNVAQYLARRGLLLMKEFKDVASVRCQHTRRITITAVIITVARSQTGERTYGVRLSQTDGEGQEEGTAFMDFDEIEPVVTACAYMESAAKKIAGQARDYTEFEYSTKDGVRVGFFQVGGEQQAFLDVSGIGRPAFLSFERLRSLREGIDAARLHLVQHGAQPSDDA